MHDTAYEIGKKFFEVYWSPAFNRILDVGSRDVNGSLRDFCPAGAIYVGIDLEPGPGVDIVPEDHNVFPFDSESFDLIVSTSAFEHDQMFWLTFAEMARVLKPGGFIYVNAPSNGRYHSFPYDNWRFYPDAGLALQAWSEKIGQPVKLVESFTARRKAVTWSDFVMVFLKGDPACRSGRHGLAAFFTDSLNIRRWQEETVSNFQRATEDMKAIAAQKKKLAALKEALDEQSAKVEQLQRVLEQRDARIAELEAATTDVGAAPGSAVDGACGRRAGRKAE